MKTMWKSNFKFRFMLVLLMKLVASHIPSDMYFALPGGILVDPAPDSCHYAAFASKNPVTPRRLPLSSKKTSLPEFFCSASLCEASKKFTGNGFFPTFVTQLDSKFWPGFASQKSRSSFCFTSFDFRFLSKFLISFA